MVDLNLTLESPKTVTEKEQLVLLLEQAMQQEQTAKWHGWQTVALVFREFADRLADVLS